MLEIKEALEIFNINNLADLEETDLKKSFRVLIIKNHPDRGGDEEKAKEINEAYSILKKLLENKPEPIKPEQPVICKIPLYKLYDIYEKDEDIKFNSDEETFILNKRNIDKHKIIVEIEVSITVDGKKQKFKSVKAKDLWNRYKIDCKIQTESDERVELEIEAYDKIVRTTIAAREKDIKLEYGNYIELIITIERNR